MHTFEVPPNMDDNLFEMYANEPFHSSDIIPEYLDYLEEKFPLLTFKLSHNYIVKQVSSELEEAISLFLLRFG